MQSFSKFNPSRRLIDSSRFRIYDSLLNKMHSLKFYASEEKHLRHSSKITTKKGCYNIYMKCK